MKSLIGGFIGLLLSVHVGAESLLEGRVRLSSGQPTAGVQVRLFDLTDLRRSVGTTTDAAGYFALSLQTFLRGTALPTDFALGQNYPNPFNPSTIIPYQLPSAGHVRLDVFNVLGQRLATLVDAERSVGMHTAQWDGTDAAGRAMGAGVYIYRLSSGGMAESRRMVLVDGQAGIPAVGAAAQGPVRVVEGAVEADDQVYGLTVSGEGLVAYVDPAFQVGVDEADIVIEEPGGSPRMKLTTDRILGDVNNDGQVDAFDALYVLLYSEDSSITLPNNGDISLGDVNGDGQVDLADAVLLATYSVNPSDPTLPPGIGQAAPDLVPPVSETSEDQNTALSHIYWRDRGTGKIQRANLDGSNIETLVNTGDSIRSGGLALDVDGGKMYWTNKKGEIQRANLDGSNIETLIFSRYQLSGLALDVDGRKMYWMDIKGPFKDPGRIQCANLDGFHIEDLVTGLDNPKDLALNVDGGEMYWIDTYATGRIQRANLDGSNIEDLIFSSSRHKLSGLALDVDGRKMYWIDTVTYANTTGRIQRADLDGSNIEDLITGLGRIEGLALDVDRGKMYWTDEVSAYSSDRLGRIQRANLDGSNIETLITGLDNPVLVALGPYYEMTTPEETPTRSPEEARAALAERSIPYSQSSFLAYAQEGNLEVVRLFVEAGLDINAQNEDEGFDTAVMRAASQGHLAVVRFLVEQGADLDLLNERGYDLPKELPFYPRLRNYGNGRKYDALMFAAEGGHVAVARFLIDSDNTRPRRDWYYFNDGPDNPLMLAAYGGHLEMVRFLVDNKVEDGISIALIWAAARGHLEVARFLIDNGATLGLHGAVWKEDAFWPETGYTALMLAVEAGHLEMVRLLIERGADIHIHREETLAIETPYGDIYFRQETGQRALTLAINRGHIEVLRLLLEHWISEYGADARDDRGRTALMYAAAAGDLEMTRHLIENGAPVNAQTPVDTTALMFASAEGHVEVVRFLVGNGADIHIQNAHGYTALSLAEEKGHQEVVDFLRSVDDAG